jgi:hypothetical protein
MPQDPNAPIDPTAPTTPDVDAGPPTVTPGAPTATGAPTETPTSVQNTGQTTSTPVPGTQTGTVINSAGHAVPEPLPTTPSVFFDRRQLNNARQATQEGIGETKQASAIAKANLLGKQTEQLGKDYNDMQHFATATDRFQNDIYPKLLSEAQAISKTQIDPNHWFNSKDTGGKLAAIGGLMLGGIGQGLQMWGGNKQAHNAAIDAMDQAIKNDIDSQDKNLKNRWDAYKAKNGVADTVMNQRHWELLDKHAQFTLHRDLFSDQLNQQAAQSDSALVKANNDQAQQALAKDRLDDDQGFAKYREGLVQAANAGLAAYQKGRLAHQDAIELAGLTAEADTKKAVATAEAAGTEARLTAEAAQPAKDHAEKIAAIDKKIEIAQAERLKKPTNWIGQESNTSERATKDIDNLVTERAAEKEAWAKAHPSGASPAVPPTTTPSPSAPSGLPRKKP